MIASDIRISRKKMIFAVLGIVLTYLALTIILPTKTQAAAYTYPEGAGIYAVSATSPGVSLDAPTSIIKVVFSANTNVFKLTLWDICFNSRNNIDYSSNAMPLDCRAGDVTVTVSGSTATGEKDTTSPSWRVDAFGTGNTPTPIFKCTGCLPSSTLVALPAPIYKGRRAIYISVVQNVGGLNGYKVTASGYTDEAQTTPTAYTKIGFGATVGSTSYPQAVMALPMGTNANVADISLTFKTPCEYTGTSFNIGWYDADRPPSSSPLDGDITWRLTNNATAQFATSTQYAFIANINEDAYLGGQGVNKTQSIANGFVSVTANTSYTWTWSNVNGNNGVQFYLPFSGADVDQLCDAPTGDATSGGTCNWIAGWIVDGSKVDQSVRYYIRVNGVNIGGPYTANLSGTNSAGQSNSAINTFLGITGNHLFDNQLSVDSPLYNEIYTASPGIAKTVTIVAINIDSNGVELASNTQIGSALTLTCPITPPAWDYKPYIRAYGGDIFAGSPICTGWPASGGIAGIYGFPGTTAGTGSGAQLGVLAMGPVWGFNSAMLRTTGSGIPQPPNDLTFASGPSPGNVVVSRCPYDYWGKKTITSNNVGPSPISLSTYFAGEYYAGSTISINSTTIPNSKVINLYVNGDLVILQNIIYQNATGATAWTSVDQIPRLQIVATGNIYIAKDVTQLDGIYVAQGGTIYTCTNGSTLYLAPTLYTNCNKQLLVNGALLATKIKWLRTFGHVGDSTASENPNTTPRNCTSIAVDLKPTCASEVVNLGPEAWMVGPSSTSPTADYIQALPPLL